MCVYVDIRLHVCKLNEYIWNYDIYMYHTLFTIATKQTKNITNTVTRTTTITATTTTLARTTTTIITNKNER